MASSVQATRRQRLHQEKQNMVSEIIEPNIIRDLVMVKKRNRDFYYWSSLLSAHGKRNSVAPNREQCYIVGVPDTNDLAGHYLVVVLKQSIKSLLGHSKITVRYLTYDQIDPVTLTFDLPERDIVDDHQLLIYLGPRSKRLRAIGWTVKIICDGKTYEKGSFIWNRLLPKYGGSPLTESKKKP